MDRCSAWNLRDQLAEVFDGLIAQAFAEEQRSEIQPRIGIRWGEGDGLFQMRDSLLHALFGDEPDACFAMDSRIVRGQGKELLVDRDRLLEVTGINLEITEKEGQAGLGGGRQRELRASIEAAQGVVPGVASPSGLHQCTDDLARVGGQRRCHPAARERQGRGPLLFRRRLEQSQIGHELISRQPTFVKSGGVPLRVQENADRNREWLAAFEHGPTDDFKGRDNLRGDQARGKRQDLRVLRRTGARRLVLINAQGQNGQTSRGERVSAGFPVGQFRHTWRAGARPQVDQKRSPLEGVERLLRAVPRVVAVGGKRHAARDPRARIGSRIREIQRSR